MANEIDPAGVQIVQQANPADISVGRSNGFMALAQGLSESSGAVQDALGAVGGQLKARAENKAMAAALESGGETFGDAVRSGKIEATQNPWFIHAYNQNASEIRGRGEVTKLLDDSQTWAERSNPQAYQARFAKEVGILAQGHANTPEGLKGFETAAAPIMSAAISSNTQANVDAIHQQFTADATSKATEALNTAAAANGGVLDSAAAGAALAPVVAQWYATGGTKAQASLLALNSIVNYAANNGRPDELRAVLSGDIPGVGILANTVGPNGESLGLQALKDSYFITRDEGAAARAQTVKWTAGANQVVNSLLGQYGLEAIKHTSPAEITAEVNKLGFTDPGEASRVGLIAATLMGKQFEGLVGLNKASVQFAETDPKVVQNFVALHEYAAINGLTKELSRRIFDQVGSGQMSKEQADSIIAEGANTNRTKFSEGQANIRQSRADEMEVRRQVADAKTHIKDYRDDLVYGVVHLLETPTKGPKGQPVVDTYFSDPSLGAKRRTALDARVRGAMSAWTLTHGPDDIVGIQNAGRSELARFLTERAAARSRAAATSLGARE